MFILISSGLTWFFNKNRKTHTRVLPQIRSGHLYIQIRPLEVYTVFDEMLITIQNIMG